MHSGNLTGVLKTNERCPSEGFTVTHGMNAIASANEPRNPHISLGCRFKTNRICLIVATDLIHLEDLHRLGCSPATCNARRLIVVAPGG